MCTYALWFYYAGLTCNVFYSCALIDIVHVLRKRFTARVSHSDLWITSAMHKKRSFASQISIRNY